MDKIYHIYAKDNCIFHCLSEDRFREIWNQLNIIIGLVNTEYKKEDLSYEELTISKSSYENASY